ncbi:uncharacterized protein C8Q71DRAFT_384598 [Rhodofomes roseus]|uniref:Carbohydrate-binding module family 19 domain-containing protein n=1 Tax=Rhodofomes roseus TaxID=34475 RepID=A0ABQ8K012_9APHY|nr:uncharacterized protein C8Q71DRAFT_384598 [Rhodofomes roseus]KAH9829961.1 hypothetical protein C8Q71DRAFT_384598 [Rhodofomes roseus]
MIDLAKQLNSDADMIKFAQIFAQQPRNTPTSQAVPYCQSAPKNAELDGLFQCQFQGANENTFVGGLSVGSPGTIPFGMTSAVSPAGSCPANPSGPIPDGQQLSDLVDSPGTGSTSGSGSGSASASAVASTTAAASSAGGTSAVATSVAATSVAAVASSTGSCVVVTATVTASDSSPSSLPSSSASSSSSPSSSSGSSFLLSNGQMAQQQNAQFATMTANDTCDEGTDACVSGQFAQCVSGSYVMQSCGASLSCFALPLVNKAGTSITCTTESDAASRIANTGATGGVSGDGSSSSSSSGAASSAVASPSAAPTANTEIAMAATSSAAAASSTSSSSSGSGFLLSNGQQAQQQNAQFSSLSASSACDDGSEACVGGQFAQCVGGSYVTQTCGASLSCFALPLVNKAGTSITCTTQDDAASRIANTGATGGVTGN